MTSKAYATKRVTDLIARMDKATIADDNDFVSFCDAADEVRSQAQEADVDPAIISELNAAVQRLASQLSFCTLE